MHVIQPTRYQPRPKPTPKWPFAIAALLLVALAALNVLRPVPTPTATIAVSLPAAAAVPIAWPQASQAAVAADDYGLLGTNGNPAPLATASIAKVILALCVLQKQPLAAGQDGVTYTIGARDVALYQHYLSINGSLIAVTEGEKLTEYQALQALMIPSANNIADSLVRWVFGNQDTYAAYATAYLRQHGLSATHIGSDASGFDPSTTSTASDLTQLGLVALQNPALMSIAGQRTATLPLVGTVYNYDTVLGVNGITGLKTGNNDADPGAFLFTATLHIGTKDIAAAGAVMGAADLNTALQGSTRLAASLQQGFEQLTIAKANQVVGTVQTAWGATAPIAPSSTLELVRWKATPLTQTHTVDVHKRSGSIGQLKIAAGSARSSSSLRLSHPLAGPSFWWRLTRH